MWCVESWNGFVWGGVAHFFTYGNWKRFAYLNTRTVINQHKTPLSRVKIDLCQLPTNRKKCLVHQGNNFQIVSATKMI